MDIDQDSTSPLHTLRQLAPITIDSEPKLQAWKDRQIEHYIHSNPRSRAAHTEACTYLPGGNTRSNLYHEPFPLTLVSGHDCFVTSLDGDELLDFVGEMTAGIFGHSHPRILNAITEATRNGISLGGCSEKEVQLAKKITERFPSMQRMRFCNSGSEANTLAIAVAINYTGRKKILVFQNGYHGGFLNFGASAPGKSTIPFEWVMARYDDVASVKQAVEDNSDTIAAIIVEPMQGAGGAIPASTDFLQFLRYIATQIGAVLIFDEIITSRLHYHGLQGQHGIDPDMTTIGKYLAGGFPFGAFGGREDIMAIMNPETGFSHSGTFNNNVFALTTAIEAADILEPDVMLRLNSLGYRLKRSLQRLLEDCVPIDVMWVTGFGSVLGIHFGGLFKELLQECFFFFLLNSGIYYRKSGMCSLCIMHTKQHTSRFESAIQAFLQALDEIVRS
ncbi:PLP-dependent transferase [Microthyrium microscopicum]|uniref:PLP-dependent transferase n=1 Tax=Microthyrium microscopicum TaxID=703497 RepID=A0A6A6UKU8_9PEZI|nr:PLP-dependent transferase [Microthyrium microscopicum]